MPFVSPWLSMALCRFSVTGNRATFSLQTDRQSFGPSFGGWYEDRTWELGLAPEVALDLVVEIGAGEADLDLTGLTVNDLDVDVSVGKTTVTLPEEGDIKVRLEGAIGEIVVVIPEGMEFRVRANTAIGSSKLPDAISTSAGYARADNRVDLEVNLAIGSIRVRHPE